MQRYVSSRLSRYLSCSKSARLISSQKYSISSSRKFSVVSRIRFSPVTNNSFITTCRKMSSSNQPQFSANFLFRQLFDRDSCTYTYLLADTDTKEAILIDPVIDLAERDAVICKDLGLKVSKFQKQIFLFSFEPRNERNYFLISALRI
jgi:hypothetical protein